MKKYIFYLACATVILMNSCSNPVVKKESDKTVFRYNELSGITSLDPAAARNFENIEADNQLFNGLVQMDDSLHVKPCIAKSWEIGQNGTQYIFHLRHDVYFQDDSVFPKNAGRKVIASDFVHSFFRLYDPSVSSATTLLSNIDRGERSNYKGFEAPDDSTFIIYLKQAFAPFLSILTMKYFSVIPIEAIDRYGDDFRSHPVGTGPFKFKVWDEGSKLILVKNDHYFEFEGTHRLPYLDAVSISFIRDKETAFLEFLQDKLDLLSGADAIDKEQVFEHSGKLKNSFKNKFYLQSQPFLKTDYLGILIDPKFDIVKNSPLQKLEIRQAINYGFDRVKMVKYLRWGLGTPATAGFVPPGLPSFNSDLVKGYTYNPDKAKQLLLLAGYPNGKGLPEITLHTTAQYQDLCSFIQSQLAAIGIKVKISVEKAAILSEAIASSEMNFFRKSWVGDYPDAENFLSLFYSQNFSPAGFNYTHYSNPHFDVLYEKSRTEENDSLRYADYQQMDQLLMDDAPIVPLYYDQVVRLVQKDISGLTANPMNLLNLKTVQKTEKGE
ncbi:MAG: ABC transporter substrate-binding protein [Bacteroidia bacterium]